MNTQYFTTREVFAILSVLAIFAALAMPAEIGGGTNILNRFLDYSSDTWSLREHLSCQVTKRDSVVVDFVDERFFDATAAESNLPARRLLLRLPNDTNG